MTDLMLKPDDTGEIPTGVGETTRNLAPYVHGLAPALRRPTAALELVTDYGKAPFGPPTLPPTPDPVPPPPPPTPSGELWETEPAPPYTGRHRRPSRWDWLTVPLAAGMQIVRAAWAKGGDR